MNMSTDTCYAWIVMVIKTVFELPANKLAWRLFSQLTIYSRRGEKNLCPFFRLKKR
jgi:hypothetical protein